MCLTRLCPVCVLFLLLDLLTHLLVMSRNTVHTRTHLSLSPLCYVVTQKMVTFRMLGGACRTVAAIAATCLRSCRLEHPAGRSPLHPWLGLRFPMEEPVDRGLARPGRWALPARKHWPPVCSRLPMTLGMVSLILGRWFALPSYFIQAWDWHHKCSSIAMEESYIFDYYSSVWWRVRTFMCVYLQLI